MKIDIKGKHELEEIRCKSISAGVHLIQIIFKTPKYFSCMSGEYSVSVFPTTSLPEYKAEGVIEIEFTPENKEENNLRFMCEGSRYIIDIVAMNRNLFMEWVEAEADQ